MIDESIARLIFILITMFFLHIFDDYYLQGCLSQLKQKKYWEENAPKEMYKHDYIIALILHAFSWSFIIMLPVLYTLFYSNTIACIIILLINVLIHTIVDDLKANKGKINLIGDQLIHLAQVFMTWYVCFILI